MKDVPAANSCGLHFLSGALIQGQRAGGHHDHDGPVLAVAAAR